MLLTIDLPAHAEPFSAEHEAATLAWIRDPQRELTPSAATTEPAYRSFVVLQFPVDHPDVPADPHKVRAVYSSFEAVSEAPAQSGDGKVVDGKAPRELDRKSVV